MATSASRICRRYLLHLANEHVDFRIPEIKAIGSFFGFDLELCAKYDHKGPFVEIELASEKEAKLLMSRTVLARSIYELWGKGTSYEDLHSSLRLLPPDISEPYIKPDVSFRMSVDAFNKSIPQKQKLEKIENVLAGHVKFEGPVNLKNPDQNFHIFEYYEEKNSAAIDPSQIYFGRWLCDSQRQIVKDYNLQERKFIANTSMDPGLSLIMANFGKAGPNDIIFDPFVGSGSLLVACAHFGSYVMGTDIDFNLLHAIGKTSRAGKKWRAKDETIRNNLRQYRLDHKYLDALVADASRGDHLWRNQMTFDAIITDPPYGIREAAVKLGSSKADPTVLEEYKDGHIPQKTTYQMSEILVDMINLAARRLKLGGRLVYWLPVYREDYKEENIPRHPCFQCVANCEQVLNSRIARRLITMEKIKEYHVTAEQTTVEEDHYGDLSFRERYFRPNGKLRDSSPTVNDPRCAVPRDMMPCEEDDVKEALDEIQTDETGEVECKKQKQISS